VPNRIELVRGAPSLQEPLGTRPGDESSTRTCRTADSHLAVASRRVPSNAVSGSPCVEILCTGVHLERRRLRLGGAFIPMFGHTPIGKLDRSALRAWVANLGSPRGSNLAPATIHRVVQLLNKCMAAALEDRLISHNPVAQLPLPRIERREMRFLTADELLTLAGSIDPRYRAFVLLGGFGGLRLGEMLGLRWGRVDLLRRRVHVAETLVDIAGEISFGPPKTKAAVRSVPLPRFVADEVSQVATANVAADRLVFQSPEGLPIRATLFRRRFWAPAVEAAELAPLRIHDLRHTAVSLWIADGANPKQIAVMAGHTSVSVVLDRYGHLYPQQDDELMDRLERRIARGAG
jgi:integrase